MIDVALGGDRVVGQAQSGLKQSGKAAAQSFCRQLAVISGLVPGGFGIPRTGDGILVHGVRRPGRPIGTARQAHRKPHSGVLPGEMLVGDFGVIQQGQGNPTSQPFGGGNVGPARLPVVPGKLIGVGDVTQVQGSPGQYVPLSPPWGGAAQFGWGRDQQGDGIFRVPRTPAPAHPFEHQPRGTQQLDWHRGNSRINPTQSLHQGNTRPGYGGSLFVHMDQDPVGAIGITVPNLVVQAG